MALPLCAALALSFLSPPPAHAEPQVQPETTDQQDVALETLGNQLEEMKKRLENNNPLEELENTSQALLKARADVSERIQNIFDGLESVN